MSQKKFGCFQSVLHGAQQHISSFFRESARVLTSCARNANTETVRETETLWREHCVKAGLDQDVWEYFNRHNYTSFKELYLNRHQKVFLYIPVSESVSDSDMLDEWSRCRVGSPKEFYSSEEKLFQHEEEKAVGCYKVTIDIMDLHIYVSSCVENFFCMCPAIPPEHVLSYHSPKGEVIENPFYDPESKKAKRAVKMTRLSMLGGEISKRSSRLHKEIKAITSEIKAEKMEAPLEMAGSERVGFPPCSLL